MSYATSISRHVPNQSASLTSASVPIVLEKPADPQILCGEKEFNVTDVQEVRDMRCTITENRLNTFSNLTSGDEKSNQHCDRHVNCAGYPIFQVGSGLVRWIS